MAWYAKINKDNIVTEVLYLIDSKDSEWLYRECGGNWLRFDTEGLRVNFPSVGYSYSKEEDVFIAPKPHETWTLNTNNFLWEPPEDWPENIREYEWNEQTKTWNKK